MDQWDEDYINMEVKAFIRIGPKLDFIQRDCNVKGQLAVEERYFEQGGDFRSSR